MPEDPLKQPRLVRSPQSSVHGLRKGLSAGVRIANRRLSRPTSLAFLPVDSDSGRSVSPYIRLHTLFAACSMVGPLAARGLSLVERSSLEHSDWLAALDVAVFLLWPFQLLGVMEHLWGPLPTLAWCYTANLATYVATAALIWRSTELRWSPWTILGFVWLSTLLLAGFEAGWVANRITMGGLAIAGTIQFGLFRIGVKLLRIR